MKYRFSVIIPIYNAENTLRRCILSLVKQKYPGVQIILVNDGSTDMSDSICRQYARKYAYITYINQENRGVACARNRGIEVAEGEWILFVDSDDYVTKKYFKIIDEQLKKYPCDLLAFSHYIKRDHRISCKKQSFFYTADEDKARKKVIDMICRKTINSPVVKAYRRNSVLKKHVLFTEGVSIAEDRAYNIKYSLSVSSICIIPDCLYVVSVDNPESLSRRKSMDQQSDFSKSEKDILETIKHSDLQDSKKHIFYQALNFCKYRSIYRIAKEFHRDGFRRSKRLIGIKKQCNNIIRQGLDYPNTLYCHLVMAPIILKWVSIIDFIGWKLSN